MFMMFKTILRWKILTILRWRLYDLLGVESETNKWNKKKLSRVYYETEYEQVDWTKLSYDYRNYVINRLKYHKKAFTYVLDAGCGQGRTLANLNSENKIGIDFSRKLLKMALKRDPSIQVVLGDITHIPFRNKVFDLVLCLDVIEHVLNAETVFEELKRVARSEVTLTTDYDGAFTFPFQRCQFIDRAPGVKFLGRWGELTFFIQGKPVPFWKGLFFAHGLMIRAHRDSR